jgi:hypothetical protein
VCSGVGTTERTRDDAGWLGSRGTGRQGIMYSINVCRFYCLSFSFLLLLFLFGGSKKSARGEVARFSELVVCCVPFCLVNCCVLYIVYAPPSTPLVVAVNGGVFVVGSRAVACFQLKKIKVEQAHTIMKKK